MSFSWEFRGVCEEERTDRKVGLLGVLAQAVTMLKMGKGESRVIV
jgi:hypothetical protein